MIGYFLIMAILSLLGEKGKKLKPSLVFGCLMLVSVMAVCSVFIVYKCKEYGKLPNAPAYHWMSWVIPFRTDLRLSRSLMQSSWMRLYNDVTVTSFSLHSLSATVRCEGRFAPDLTNNFDRAIYVVMKDGSKIQLYSSSGAVGVQHLTPEKAIDLEQVDHILLADGTRLFVPQ